MTVKRILFLCAGVLLAGIIVGCDVDSSGSEQNKNLLSLMISSLNNDDDRPFSAEEMFAIAAISASPAVTIKEVPAGLGKGTPYGAVPTKSYFPGSPVFDLNAIGYVEKEFFISGKANTYAQSGIWTTSGKWRVTVSSSNVPYTTRMITRFPSDPARFNGTVIVEWMNETTGLEASPDWSESFEYFLREGFAYIGITAQNGEAGPTYLKSVDPVRYASLSISTDGLSYDIYTQMGRAVKAQTSDIFPGLTVKKVLAAGDSQSAMRLNTYVNCFQMSAKVYDGLMLHGRSGVAAPLGDGLLLLYPVSFIRSDNTTPVIQIYAEGDLIQASDILSRQSDNNYLRTWEVAGAAHVDLYEGAYEMAVTARDNPSWPKIVCLLGLPNPVTGGGLITRLPYHRIECAGWDALRKWVYNGTRPPQAPFISTSWLGIIQRDSYGNALGGVRLPEVDVPISTYYYYNIGADISSAFVCMLSGYDQPFDAATLKKLYPTHADYVNKYTANATKKLNAGFLLKADYDKAIAEAQAAAIPE